MAELTKKRITNKARVKALERRRKEAMAMTGAAVAEGAGSNAASLLGRYEQFCYGIIGERLDEEERKTLQNRLKQADYNMTPGMYRALQWVTTALAFIFVVPLFMLASSTVSGGPDSLQWGAGVGATAVAATYAAFPLTVNQRITKRRGLIDKELPFSLSELAVLATIGLSPIQLMDRMGSREHDAAMTGEFRTVHYKSTVQGKDIVGALAETAKESPSDALREVFWDMGNMMHQGGDLGPYLRDKAAHMMEVKRRQQKTFVDQLSGYADMFVTVALIGLIFLAIGAFVMDAFGNTAGGLGAKQVLQLLTYGFMPMVVFVVGLLISTAYSRYQ